MAAVRHIGFFVRMPESTSEVALLVFIIVQNLDQIGWVVLIISKFKFFAIWLEIAYSRSILGDLGAKFSQITS